MKKFVVVIFSFLFSYQISAQEITQKFYGDYFLDEKGTSLVSTPDGGFVFGGERERDSTGTDVYVFKTDSLGLVEWEIASDDPLDYHCTSVISTNDGGFLISGYSSGFFQGLPFAKLFFWKVDANGQPTWEMELDKGFNWELTKTLELPGGDLVSIFNGSPPIGDRLPCMIKMDSQGNVIWNRQYGESAYSHFEDIIITLDGNLMVVGRWKGLGSRDSWFLKTDLNGQVLLEKIIDRGYDIDFLYSDIVETKDGNFISAGVKTYEGHTSPDSICLIKMNNQGAVLWEKTISGGDYSYSFPQIERVSGDTFLLVSIAKVDDPENNFPRIAKTFFLDEDVSIFDIATYQSGSLCHYISGLEVLPFGGFAAIGSGIRPNGQSLDFYLLKRSPNFPDTTIVDEFNELLIAPNPSSGKLTVGYKSELTRSIELEIFNAAGQIVYMGTEDKNTSVFQKKFSFQNLPTGTYFIRLSEDGHSLSGRWVKK